MQNVNISTVLLIFFLMAIEIEKKIFVYLVSTYVKDQKYFS